MPPHIQPLSLREMLIDQVAQMSFHAFIAIERKYERFEWSASQQKEVSDLQEFLLSNIQHIWDDVCQVICQIYIVRDSPNRHKMFQVYRCRHKMYDFRIFTTFLIHDRMRKLALSSKLCMNFRSNSLCLSESQIWKLRNIVKLDIEDIKVTNKMLEIIGSICKDLNDICITLRSQDATLNSLCNLLKCRDLQILDISLKGWTCKQYRPYFIKFLTELPKLKLCYRITEVLPKLKSDTSIEHVVSVVRDANELGKILKRCPHVQNVSVNIEYKSHVETPKVQFLLAECSLKLSTLEIMRFNYGESMGRLLELKGMNLKKLSLKFCEGQDTTLNDVYVIGINCPKLEELSISEKSYRDCYDEDPFYRSPVLTSETLIAKTPTMFHNLRWVHLSPRKVWDIRLLLQILLNASSLKQLSIMSGYYFHGFPDVLSEILSVNPLTELERLSLEMLNNPGMTPQVSQDSIERLMISCPRLKHLKLELPMDDDTLLYMEELYVKVLDENLDLELKFDGAQDPYIDSDDFDTDEYDVFDDFDE